MISTVVTGMGVVSTAGFDLETFWDTLEAGRITYGEVDDFKNNSNYRITIGAVINDMSWNGNVPEDIKKHFGKASNYAVSTVGRAMENAGLKAEYLPKGRTAIVFGTTMGEIQVEEQITRLKSAGGLASVPDTLFSQYRSDNISLAVNQAFGISGPVYTVSAACAAGNYAIGLGKRLIEWGNADVAIVGGVDVFSQVAFTGFQRLLSLAPDVCRPFDLNRKGLVVGEGCGVLILEREGWRRAQEAYTCGRVIGVGLASDRYHMTSPHPDGDGAARAIRQSLNEAGLRPGQIDYISAHGTGTKANDRIEIKALAEVFGFNRIPPASSIKSMLGHTMGAASALELIASFLMLKKSVMLPTVNYETPDPECAIDCIPNEARKREMRFILSNSFAFGGQTSSIIISKR